MRQLGRSRGGCQAPRTPRARPPALPIGEHIGPLEQLPPCTCLRAPANLAQGPPQSCWLHTSSSMLRVPGSVGLAQAPDNDSRHPNPGPPTCFVNKVLWHVATPTIHRWPKAAFQRPQPQS